MKRITAIVLVSAAFCGGQAAAMPPEAAAVFEKAGVTVTNSDLYRIAEIYNFWEQKGESIWPGVDIATTPIQLVFPEKLGVLVGHRNPPEDCVMEEIKLPGFNKTFCHMPDRSFLHGAGAGRVGKGLAVSLNPMDLYDDYINEYYRKNNIKADKYSKPYLQYLGEVAHELMHAHQAYEGRMMPYVYYTGTALAYSMDKAAPGWKKDIFRKILGFKTGLDDIITANIKPEGSAGKRLKAVFARYKADEMRGRVKAALDKDLAENKVKPDKFRAAPGKRYAFLFRGAKPADIQIFAPGLLTEYKELRVYEAGITMIRRGREKKNGESLLFSKALPVLMNRETGRFELAQPDAGEPVVKAGKTAAKKNKTVYRGGVEFSNGVFSWKGDKLEVSEKDGITTLTF